MGFICVLGEKAVIDFYIYNNDLSLFKKLLQNRKDDHTLYVIIPQFLRGGENANEIINEISGGQQILLDKLIPGIKREYAAIYGNFEHDIFDAVKKSASAITKISYPKN